MDRQPRIVGGVRVVSDLFRWVGNLMRSMREDFDQVAQRLIAGESIVTSAPVDMSPLGVPPSGLSQKQKAKEPIDGKAHADNV